MFSQLCYVYYSLIIFYYLFRHAKILRNAITSKWHGTMWSLKQSVCILHGIYWFLKLAVEKKKIFLDFFQYTRSHSNAVHLLLQLYLKSTNMRITASLFDVIIKSRLFTDLRIDITSCFFNQLHKFSWQQLHKVI